MAPSAEPTPIVRPAAAEELPRLEQIMRRDWGSDTVVSRGRLHRTADLSWLVAGPEQQWLGVAGYRLDGDECELVVLEAFERHRGTGTLLLDAVAGIARQAGARRLWLITTNDNTDGLRFYQRRGMRLARLWRDAVSEARRTLKPEIPPSGEFGIPITDELELEMILSEGDRR
jgi:GNAT superfamily N-acetyltransferase